MTPGWHQALCRSTKNLWSAVHQCSRGWYSPGHGVRWRGCGVSQGTWCGSKGSHVAPTDPQVLSFLPHRLYLGNPMDPPDILGVDPSAARPTQLPGRAKSERLFPFPRPVSCAKPLSPCPAARAMGWTLSFPSLLPLAFRRPGGAEVTGCIVTWPCATASSVGGQWLCPAGLCPAALRPGPSSCPSLPWLGSPVREISTELPQGGS